MVRVLTRGNPHYTMDGFLAHLRQAHPSWDVSMFEGRHSVDVARCTVFAQARQADVDFLLMFDDDGYPNEACGELPYWDVPVVAGLVPTVYKGDHLWNAYERDGDYLQSIKCTKEDIEAGLKPVFAIGGHVLCIRKDVLHDDRLQPPFMIRRRADGTMLMWGGEDTDFSLKCQAAGIPIYVDPLAIAEHYRPTGIYQTMLVYQQNRRREGWQPSDEMPTQYSIDVRGLEFDVPEQVAAPPLPRKGTHVAAVG